MRFLHVILIVVFLMGNCGCRRIRSASHNLKDVTEYTRLIARIAAKSPGKAPDWMFERINSELEPFKSKKISLSAIENTYEQFIQVVDRGTRYRFIDGTVYRKGPDPFGMDAFFSKIARYAEHGYIDELPNIEFIWNHEDATPLEFQSRDFWITKNFEDQAPIFSYAVKKNCPYLISVPDRFTLFSWESLSESILEANCSYPWDSKLSRAFWRGQCNDYARLGPEPLDFEETFRRYSKLARYQICVLGAEFPEYVDAGFNGFGFANNEKLEKIAQPFFRIGISPAEHLEYAYLPVLDGYTSTYPGYLWRLLSNSLAFKQDSDDSQWFYDALKPYVHYIPVKNQMEDLIDKINWARKENDLCQKIALNATEFVISNLMIEDIYLYFTLLFKAYRECLSFDTKDLLQVTEEDPCWVKI